MFIIIVFNVGFYKVLPSTFPYVPNSLHTSNRGNSHKKDFPPPLTMINHGDNS